MLNRTECVVCSLGFLWRSTHYSNQTKGQVKTDMLLNFHKNDFLCYHACFQIEVFLRRSSSVPVWSNKHSHSVSFSVSASNGSRDQPEPGPHALCHGLRFLWQPTNQWHVLCVLQGTPDATAEQRPHEPPQPDG